MLPTKAFTVTIKRAGRNPLVLRCGSQGNSLRGTCTIEEGGTDNPTSAEIVIFGVSPEHLKNFSSLALHKKETVQRPETVTVSIDSQIIFYGDTFLAFADYSQFPEISLKISAVFGFSAALVQGDPFYIKAADRIRLQDAASKLVSQLNNDLGLTDKKARLSAKFSKSARSIICPDMVLTGTSISKIHVLADALGVNTRVDYSGVYFWSGGKDYPAEFLRKKPVISVDTGLLGYPVFYNEGINFTTSNVGIWKVCDYVKIKSTVPYADGDYFIMASKSELSTLPGGRWETSYTATYAL